MAATVIDGVVRRRRSLYAVTSAVLTAIVALAVLDGVGALDVYGPDTATVSASGAGYELEVVYANVSRPALATPFTIVVRRDGGFTEPVFIAIEHDYLGIWDANGIAPAPASETTSGDWLVWEFDPPKGDELRVVMDSRIEPAAQSGRSGRVAVLEDDVVVVEVGFTTRVMP